MSGILEILETDRIYNNMDALWERIKGDKMENKSMAKIDHFSVYEEKPLIITISRFSFGLRVNATWGEHDISLVLQNYLIKNNLI